MTKKSKNISPSLFSKFTKIIGKFFSKDEERTQINIGYRYNYSTQKRHRQIHVHKMDENGSVTQTLKFPVSKKNIKDIIYILKFALKHEKDFFEEDEHD